MAVRITPEGNVDMVFSASRSAFTLKELYAAINCETVEIVRLWDGRYLIVDEDGLRKMLPLNPAATVLYHRGRNTDHPIVGVVLLTQSWEVD